MLMILRKILLFKLFFYTNNFSFSIAIGVVVAATAAANQNSNFFMISSCQKFASFFITLRFVFVSNIIAASSVLSFWGVKLKIKLIYFYVIVDCRCIFDIYIVAKNSGIEKFIGGTKLLQIFKNILGLQAIVQQ